MSYILDALNKADSARKQQQPEQTTAPRPTPQTKAKPSWIWGLLALLGIIIAVTFWWLNQEQENIRKLFTSQPTPIIQPSKTKPTEPVISQHADTIATVKHTPKAVPATMPTHAAAQHTTTTITQQPQAIPHILDLDTAIQNKLPSIAITAHVYSADTKKRMVMINNHVLHEGDAIADGLTLKSIDEQGVTLALDGAPFTMKTKDTWPPY